MVQHTSERVLVTGGGGFLGSAIVSMLVQRGDRVRSFSRRFYPKLDQMAVEQIQGDIRDHAAVLDACAGIDLVFHVAAKPGISGDYKEYFGINVTGTKNIIAACRLLNINRLVYTSSPSVVFDGSHMEGVNESVPYPSTYHAHYPKTKAMAEKMVVRADNEGLNTIILRPHLIWGPNDNHLIPRIIKKADRLRIIGDGKNLVDTIYIDNAAGAHILAADHLKKKPGLSGNIYFISQDDPIPAWDMINAILHAAGLKPVTRSIPIRTARMIGALCEAFYRVLPLKGEPPMTRFLADELSTSHWFDISAAKKDLGYYPKVSIQEGLHRLTEWLRQS
jgi:nucleoside-diphosphate-sugar epimerase